MPVEGGSIIIDAGACHEREREGESFVRAKSTLEYCTVQHGPRLGTVILICTGTARGTLRYGPYYAARGPGFGVRCVVTVTTR